jgi:glycerol uptake facilitator protein
MIFANFIAELAGTALLILLGNGVVSAVLLKDSKAEGRGFDFITMGWALAVTIAVFAVGRISGAHLNPAVTIALAVTGQFDWAQVGPYVIAQLLGAFIGSVLVYVHYLPHWRITVNADAKLAAFATGPAIRNTASNFTSEFIGTFVLMFGLSAIGATRFAEGLAPFAVGGLILAIGHSLGGPTGYAINPARDLGPRIAHFLLPIPGKGSSDWGYAWIPVFAPILGAIAGAATYRTLLP